MDKNEVNLHKQLVHTFLISHFDKFRHLRFTIKLQKDSCKLV